LDDLTQVGEAPVYEASDGSRRARQQLGDVGVAQVAEVPKDHCGPLAEREPEQDIPEVDQLARHDERIRRWLVTARDNGPAVMGTAGVDHRSPQVASGMVERHVESSPQEDVVDQILGHLIRSGE
jgi:hypothetical protein